jgi:hypothetical protein
MEVRFHPGVEDSFTTGIYPYLGRKTDRQIVKRWIVTEGETGREKGIELAMSKSNIRRATDTALGPFPTTIPERLSPSCPHFREVVETGIG